MKRICTSLSILCLFCLNTSAQSFVSEDKQWSIISKGGPRDYLWEITGIFKFMGDSTLNETLYNKLFESSDNGESWEFNSLWYENNDSIFSYSTYHKKDFLIYNFNIEERDSFSVESIERYLYVDSVRTQ